MTRVASLADVYATLHRLAMERRDGVLQLTLHTNGDSLRWGPEPHDELWWIKDKLKREQLSSLPPALVIRLDVQTTLANLPESGDNDSNRNEDAMDDARSLRFGKYVLRQDRVVEIALTTTELRWRWLRRHPRDVTRVYHVLDGFAGRWRSAHARCSRSTFACDRARGVEPTD